MPYHNSKHIVMCVLFFWQKLHLGYNEIGPRGGLELARAMRNKEKLILLDLDGNMFGETGRQNLQSELKDSGKLDMLGSLK